MRRKSGNSQNKKHPTSDRLLYSPSSNRSYVRRKTNSGVKSGSTINEDEIISDLYSRKHQYNSFFDDRTIGAARVKKNRDAKKLK